MRGVDRSGLNPPASRKAEPFENPARFYGAVQYAGTSSRVVEIEATSKLEAMLARIKGIKNIYSTSDNGSGSITIELDKYADIDAVRFEASTIIRQTWPQLPDGVSYPYIRMKRPDENASALLCRLHSTLLLLLS